MLNIKSNARGMIVFVLGLLVCTATEAWYGGGGNTHYHGEDIRVYNPGGYYDRGFYYGPGPNFIVPNVIINVPAPVQRYYVPVCEEVEVCDSYGECWLDRYCN